jgi:hypothetical protein
MTAAGLPVSKTEDQEPNCVRWQTDDFRDRRYVAQQLPDAPGIVAGARAAAAARKEHIVSLGTILLIVLILILVGVLPTWPHARSWGYAPSGIAGTLLLIVVILFVLGRL